MLKNDSRAWSLATTMTLLGDRIGNLGRRGLMGLFYAATLILALAAMPAQAATYPCSVGPSDIPTLHVTNAGDGSYQDIGLTLSAISSTSGSCNNLANQTSIRPSLNGVADGTVPAVHPGWTTQGGGLGHPTTTSITYAPPSPTFTGTDTFKLDNNNTARVINVTVVVDAPTPVSSSFTASATAYNMGSAGATSINLSSHVTNTATSYAVGSATTAQGGTVSVNSSGVASYTPPAGFRGNDSFTYTASNSAGTSSASTVTVPVSNPTLTIGLDVTTGTVGTALPTVNITTSGGRAPYSCAAGTGTLPAGVTRTGCTLAGTPTAAGVSTFTIAVTDSSTGTGPFTQTSNTLTFTVQKAASSTTLTSDNNPSIQSANVTFTATVTGANTPSGQVVFKDGATTLNTATISGGVASYTTSGLSVGSHTITANYGGDSNNSASVSADLIQVVNAPAPPIVASASANVTYNTAKAIDLSASITGGPHTSITVASGPTHGSTSVSGDIVTYTPTNGYFGSDSFTYTATGPGGTSSAATVTITVGNPPAPTVSAASANVAYNTAKAIDLAASITGGPHTSITVASGPAHGSTSVSGDVVTYAPTNGYIGSDSFTYTATGPGGTSSAATVSLTVAAPAAPTAAPASANVSYNTAKAIDLSASITGGPHTSITVASGPAHGATSISGDVVTYTPTNGYFGSDSFTYTATGPGGTSSAATVSITVATPAAPTVSAASANVTYDTAKAIDLSASITGVHSAIAVASGPAHGTISIAGDVVTYTPTAGYFGSDSFTYTATGPGGTSSAATVSITVANPSAPTVAAASAMVAYNTAKAIDLSGSISGVHTSINVASGPAHGTTTVSGDVVTYTPSAGYFGSDSFTYTATGPGGTSADATVTITVATPGAPSASPVSATVTYNTAKAIDLSASITGVHSSIAVASGPAHGTTSIAGDVVTYTPTAGYFGSDSFTYTATGPGGTSAPATVTITVGIPSAPTVAAASANVGYNTAKPIDLSASITGVHGSIAVASGPAHGATSVSGDVVTYTPTSGYSGADSFTYTATGPGGTSAPATVTITVAASGIPTVTATSANIGYNSPTPIDLSGSITGAHSSIAVASAPAHGTTSVSGDVVTYTPTNGYSGPDSFTYTAAGPGGTSAPATVSLMIATPGAPTVAAASASVTLNTAKAIDLSASITGVHTSIAVASGPAHGATSVSGDVVTYTPTSGYTGADSFTYTATGPGGTSAAATVSLTIAALSAPVANPTSANIGYNTARSIDLSSSITGAHTSIAVASAAAHGSTSVSGDTITYTPATGYSGSDSFTYTATGPGGTSAPATVSLTIAPPPAPTVAGASATVVFNTAKAIDLSTAVSGIHTSIAVASGPAHGTTSVAGDVVNYMPTSGYSGADSFTYTATGPGGTSAAATVSITVAASGIPLVAPVSANVPYNTAQPIDLTASITGTHSAVTIASEPAHGTATVSGNIVTYRPSDGYVGSDSFTYTATGPGGVSTPATVTVTIIAPPAPTVGAVSASADYGTPKAIDLSGAITGVHTNVAVVTAAAHGTTSVAGDTITYTPIVGYVGADSFTYHATGPGGTSAPATVSITVAAAVPPQATPASTQVTISTVQNVSSTNINLSSLVTGFYDRIVIVTPPKHGTVVLIGAAVASAARRTGVASERAPLSGVTAVYTPDANYVGPDSFFFTATGPGGQSAPAEVSITVVGNTPIAQAKTASTTDNQRVAIDLTAGAANGPFTGAVIVATSPADSAEVAIVQGGTADAPTYVLNVTPKPHFGGKIVVTYQLRNQFGLSQSAVATITVTARPDPSADPRIRAISDAQAQTARDFSRTQVDNFMRRMERLHGRDGHRSDMGARLALDALIGRQIADDPRDNERAHGLDILRDEQIRTQTDARNDANADAATAATNHKAGSGGGSGGSQTVAFWTGGALEVGRRDGTSNRARMNVSTSGLSGGVDMKAAEGLIVGLGGGYGFNVTKLAHDGGRVSGHDAIGAAYFSAMPTDGSFIDGVAGYGDIRFHTRRVVTETGDTALATRKGNLGFASLSTGIERGDDRIHWSIYGRGDYERADLDGYTENGADIYDLRFGRRVVRSLTSVLGGRFALNMPMANGGMYTPSLRAEWSHEFQKSSLQTVDYADIAGPSLFGIETLDWGREEFSLSIANQFRVKSWEFGAELGVRAAEKERTGTLRLMVKKGF